MIASIYWTQRMRVPSTILGDLTNTRNMANWLDYKRAHALSGFSEKHASCSLLLTMCHLFSWFIIIENICTFAVWSIERRRNWRYYNNNNKTPLASFHFLLYATLSGRWNRNHCGNDSNTLWCRGRALFTGAGEFVLRWLDKIMRESGLLARDRGSDITKNGIKCSQRKKEWKQGSEIRVRLLGVLKPIKCWLLYSQWYLKQI